MRRAEKPAWARSHAEKPRRACGRRERAAVRKIKRAAVAAGGAR